MPSYTISQLIVYGFFMLVSGGAIGFFTTRYYLKRADKLTAEKWYDRYLEASTERDALRQALIDVQQAMADSTNRKEKDKDE